MDPQTIRITTPARAGILGNPSDGFFGKTPWQRIKVALAGPLANLIFAFLAFALLWISGGREQNFQFFSKKIGAIDTNSVLYAKGIRAGDEILKYNDRPYQDFKDLLFASVSKKKNLKSINDNIKLKSKNVPRKTLQPQSCRR